MIPRDLEAIARWRARELPVLTITGPVPESKRTFCRSVFADKAYASFVPSSRTSAHATSTRLVRTFDAPQILVWRAHTEPELVRRWWTGPPDHSLIGCEIDFRVGGKARYVWKNPDFEMGVDVEFLEIAEDERIVHTEDFEGWPEGRCTLTTTFVESHGRTTVTVDIQYLTREARDTAMQPGFAEGYEASYAQLDALIEELRARS